MLDYTVPISGIYAQEHQSFDIAIRLHIERRYAVMRASSGLCCVEANFVRWIHQAAVAPLPTHRSHLGDVTESDDSVVRIFDTLE